jgi:hypothetical protein
MKTTAGFVLALLAIITMVVATGQLAADRVRASANVRHPRCPPADPLRPLDPPGRRDGTARLLAHPEADYLDPFCPPRAG